MNALPSEELRVAGAAAADPVPLRTAAPEQRRPWPSLWALVATPRGAPVPRHSHRVLGLRGVLECAVRQQHAGEHRGDPGEKHVFAPYCARLLQHLFLYPVLLGCVWASLRIGWQSMWRKLPAATPAGVRLRGAGPAGHGNRRSISTGDPAMRAHVMQQGHLGVLESRRSAHVARDHDDLPVDLWIRAHARHGIRVLPAPA